MTKLDISITSNRQHVTVVVWVRLGVHTGIEGETKSERLNLCIS